jgi:hypothetical protein
MANVGQLTGDDPRNEVEWVIVDHRTSETMTWSPHVPAVLPVFVQAQAEETDVLHHPGVPSGCCRMFRTSTSSKLLVSMGVPVRSPIQ